MACLNVRGRMTMRLHLRTLGLAVLLTGVSSLAFAADDWQARVVELKPGFALGGWLAFEPIGDQAMVMGDLVLTMDEVSPVMKKLAEGGIEVTALHNHLLRNQPLTMYMHVLGHGDPVKLAAVLHNALGESKTPLPGA